MQKTAREFYNQQILEGLARLNEKHVLLFKRMYSPGNLEAPTEAVVAKIPDEKIDWALAQVQNTPAPAAEDE